MTNGKLNGAAGAVATPIFSDASLNDEDYAKIRMRLDLYDDLIVATNYDATARAGASFVVDPLDLAAALADLSLHSGLLPKNCLFWGKKNGQDRIGIYIEPQVWPVSVQGDKHTWHVPLPGLVFIGQAKKYQIYAVKERPEDPSAALFTAPVSNMSGAICRGDAPFPVASPDTIWQAADAFFQSGFNNHLDQNKSKKHPDSVLKMWSELAARKGATEYPLDDLLRAQAGILKRVMEE